MRTANGRSTVHSARLRRAMAIGTSFFLAAMTLTGCGAGPSPSAGVAGSPSPTPAESASAGSGTAIPSSPSPPMGAIDLATLTGRIAFSGGGRHAEDVYVIDANGANERRVSSDPNSDFDPSWSPDGASIAYRHQEGLDPTSEIWVIGTDGSAAHDVSDMPGTADWGASWSPLGDTIAWNSQGDLPIGFRLALVAPDGTHQRTVPGDRWVEYPSWSPDAKKVAFMSQQPNASGNDPNYDIYVMGIDGSGLTQLTNAPGEDGFPTWSPDGTMIAFSSTRDDCRNAAADCRTTGDIGPYHTLYVMNADGSGVRRVSFEYGMIPDWAPDGRYLVTEGPGGLRVVTVDGTAMAAVPVSVAEPGFPDWLP